MYFWSLTTKVFAFFLLFFVNFVSTGAQTEPDIYQLQTGTKIRVRMDNGISSEFSSQKDTFTVVIVEPVISKNLVLLPLGTVIEGNITEVKRAALSGKQGKLTISFDSLKLPNGEKRQIEGVLNEEFAKESTKTSNILAIIGGTAFGTIVGAASREKSGALIGAGIGLGAGMGITFLRKGKEVSIKSSEEFEIRLTKNVTLPLEDY
jgi:hypothetical protein